VRGGNPGGSVANHEAARLSEKEALRSKCKY
jgi:hypothetical protein